MGCRVLDSFRVFYADYLHRSKEGFTIQLSSIISLIIWLSASTAMPNLVALFAIVVVPILFFMITWVAITACRLLFPPEHEEVVEDPGKIRYIATQEGYSIPVGVREIKEDQRFYSDKLAHTTYHYEYGDSEGLPLSWFEEIVNRRN